MQPVSQLLYRCSTTAMGDSTSANEHGPVPIKQQKQPAGHSVLTPETKDLKLEIWVFSPTSYFEGKNVQKVGRMV